MEKKVFFLTVLVLIILVFALFLFNLTGKIISSEECLSKYDFNSDGKVDFGDENFIKQRIGNLKVCSAENNFCGGDIDKNGFVEPADLSLLTSCLNGLKKLTECDVNGDGGVEPSDMSVLINLLNGMGASYGVCSSKNNFCDGADTNFDGKVNETDINFFGNFVGCESWTENKDDKAENDEQIKTEECSLNNEYSLPCPEYEKVCEAPENSELTYGRINAEELDSSLYPEKTSDSGFYKDIFVYCDFYCDFENTELCRNEQIFTLYDGTKYWESMWSVSDEEGRDWMSENGDDHAFFDSYIVEENEICNWDEVCEKNSAPKIESEDLQRIFVKENSNSAVISENNSFGNLNLNSIIYSGIKFSDEETPLNILKIKMGSSKNIEDKKVLDFSCEDIGINFSKLPFESKFSFEIKDDGRRFADGEKQKENEKSDSFEKENILWCPMNASRYSAYDVQAVAKEDIKKGWFTIYSKDEEIFPKMYKNLSYDIYFDENSEIRGNFNFYTSTKRRSDIGVSRENIERAMSYAITKMQQNMKEIGINFPEGIEIANWGCKKGEWKYDDVKNGSEIIKGWACSAYEDVEIKYFGEYDFEKKEFIMYWGSGISLNNSIKLRISHNSFIKLLNIIGSDRPSSFLENDAVIKEGNVLILDWTLNNYESPSNLTSHLKEIIDLCSEKTDTTKTDIFKIKGVSVNSKFLRNFYESVKSFFGRLV